MPHQRPNKSHRQSVLGGVWGVDEEKRAVQRKKKRNLPLVEINWR